MDDKYEPLFKESIDELAERWAKLDRKLIETNAEQLIDEGMDEYSAYETAREEYHKRMRQSNDNRTVTSTAVETVFTDTYKANLPSQTQNTQNRCS